LIDPDTMDFVPTNEHIAYWEAQTGAPFSFVLTDESETVGVSCPKCLCSTSVPWVNKEGTGLGQIGFAIDCVQCGLAISRDALSVAMFLNDLSGPESILA
jgi:hypothetical protein